MKISVTLTISCSAAYFSIPEGMEAVFQNANLILRRFLLALGGFDLCNKQPPNPCFRQSFLPHLKNHQSKKSWF